MREDRRCERRIINRGRKGKKRGKKGKRRKEDGKKDLTSNQIEAVALLTSGEMISANSLLFFPEATSDAVVPYCRKPYIGLN